MTDASSGKVPVGQVVALSWSFLIENWRLLFPAALVVAAIATAAPVLVLAATGPTAGGVYLGLIFTMLADVLFTAAVLRKAVRDEFPGPTGLAFGRDEANLIGVLLCTILLLTPIVFVLGLVFSAAMAGRLVAAGVDPNATEIPIETVERVFWETLSTPAGALSAVALVLAVVYVIARLVMANAATIGERKVVFLQTWSWSKGNVARVVAALLLTALPVVLLNVLVSQLLAGVQAGSLAVALVVGYITSLISLIVSVPVIALGANLHKGLRPPNFVAK